MNSLTRQKLGDISDSCLGKMLDKEKNKGDFHPYLANYNVRWGDFDLSNIQEMKFEYHEHDRYGLEYGDLVICEGGEPGRCAVWRDNTPDMKIQKALHRLRVKSGFSYDFLYYRMLLASRTGELQKYFIGSTIKHLTGVALKQVEFDFPSHEEQVAIAAVLRSLDQKIELNNRINAELEAMAKTLYDYWFVQFDFPDSNGKPYKASGGKMVYNDTLKREIPQDWKVNKLVEITSLIRRGISPKYTEESGTQVLNQKCIRNQKISFEDSRRHQAIMDDDDERLLKPFDVLVNSTGVGTLGRVAYVKRLAEMKTTVDSHVSIVRANPDKVYPRYLAWKLMRYQPVIEAAANGSTGQVELNKSFLEDINVIIPSDSVAKKFSEFVEPIALSVAKRESENEQLISLRDWLLPMLMNGQVTVKPSTEPLEA